MDHDHIARRKLKVTVVDLGQVLALAGTVTQSDFDPRLRQFV